MTPEQRVARASNAAIAMHAAGKTNTSPARAAFRAKLAASVDPSLSGADKAAAVKAALSEHYREMARRSWEARRKTSDA